MKRIILSAIAIVLGFGIVAAQTPSNSKQPSVKAEKKEVQAAPAPKQTQPVKAVVPTSTSKTKAEDPNISTNPAPVPASKAQSPKPATISPAGPETRTKKDGTPDKSNKENKNLKKDGAPDKRYKENKPVSPKSDGTKKK
jgi:hypothetical protein